MTSKLTFIVCLFIVFVAKSQPTKIKKTVEYNFESALILSNGQTPFWQRANQYSTVPLKSPLLFATAIVKTDYLKDSLGQNRTLLGWGAGLDGVVNIGGNSRALLPEAYLKLHVGKFEIWGGRRKERYGLVGDSTLTTGAYSWSGNAMPIPKVQLNTLGFIDVPFTRRWLAFQGTFAHGWLGDLKISAVGQGGQDHAITYLHQKSFFGRLGQPQSKVRLYAGFVHNAQWGNEIKFWPNYSLTNKENYLGVVFGDSWQSSRIGNHLGSIDFGFDVKGKEWTTIFMRQNFFEAGAVYWLRAIPDGLNSLSIRRNFSTRTNKLTINRYLFEFFHSINQGGDRNFDLGIYGQEDNFNHYVYEQGWAYRGKIIGTPFITRYDEAKSTWPTNSNANNTRVYVWHIGAVGTYKEWNWQSKLSLSQNWGNFNAELVGKPLQLSGIIEADKSIKLLGGSQLVGKLSFDLGKLYYNSVGLYVGVRKNGVLSSVK